MLMHAIHGNGVFTVRANGNTAMVDSGVYSVNGREEIRKSSNSYKNQNRIHKLMTGLMKKYGSFKYENQIYLMKGLDLWESEATFKPMEGKELQKSVRWG